ncbi:carbonic anhydrase [Penaeicola halotolerans]|uniref:carbonic anhydrase n=1 Tax=Penaeicola halotolerans TaxID=2793196 RepID=UPI001CF8670B|nr:carbonic anhydrase [Penaeicola halotolerans]
MQQSYQKLLENNQKWVRAKLALNENYFKELAVKQTPRYLWIGCSDSRVPANEITGTDAGEMFMHRNIANLVVHTDMNLMSVMQYAVDVLKVEHIIVCGHYGCGGIKASLENTHHGLIDKWLRNIKDVYRLNRSYIDNAATEEDKINRLVEANVREQVFNIYKTSFIQKALKSGQDIQVHGWVYDLRDGIIKDLDIHVDQDFKDFDLYQFDL